MMQLSLTLFGAFGARIVTLDSEAERGHVTLPTDKTRALLIYLTLTPDVPLRREALAALLWPDQPEAMARQNLRKTLARLRKAIDARQSGYSGALLTVTRQTIELHGDACRVDVVTFRQALQDVQKHGHGELARCPPCLEHLERAVTLFRQGDFLAGLSLPDAAPFEAWMREQREALHRRQLHALQALAEVYEAQGLVEKARQFTRWRIAQEPWSEEAHRRLMRLLAGQGRRAEAIAQYQSCREVLRAELDVEPSPETEALLTQIMDGSFLVTSPGKPRTGPHRLPHPRGPLIGREREIGEILGMLGSPTCRLLTLSGPGGVGKTSLALAVAQRLSKEKGPLLAPGGPFGDGLYFVALAGVSDAEHIPTLVAEALVLTLHNRHAISEQVERAIRDKSLLLILDNVEQLLPDLSWLRRLCGRAPHLKLFVTSREALNWQDEWRYPLQGLPYPQEEETGEHYEAVRLFVQSARQVQPSFRYTADNGPAIARICRLVHGWPLALQMAAGWVRMMSCQAIAEQIGAGLDLLTSSLRDIPSRQRSMRVVFEHTWTALDAAEQDALRQLAIFQGGFSRTSAEAVTGITPHLLLSLVDKSLVQVDHDADRYHQHELLRQFALEKAQSQAEAYAVARERHGRYYLQWIAVQGERLRTVQSQKALADVKADLENVRRAWLWAAETQEIGLLDKSVDYLARFYESAGLPQEAVAFFRRTREALEGGQTEGEIALHARIRYHMAQSLGYMGHYEDATKVAAEAKAMAQSVDDVPLVNLLLIAQAHIFREQGRYERAQTVLQEAIAFSRTHENPEGVARALRIQGNAYWSVAAYDLALNCYEEARQIHRQLRQTTAAALVTGNIGTVYWRQGRLREALENYEVALAAHRSAGDAFSIAVWLGNIGLVYVDLQDDERALNYLDDALAMHTQLGRKFYKIELLLGKTDLYLRRGDIQKAAQSHREALDLAQQIGNRTYLLDCDLWQARLHMAQGRATEAVQLLQLLLVREFRPDMSQIIFEELSAALAGGASDSSPSKGTGARGARAQALE